MTARLALLPPALLLLGGLCLAAPVRPRSRLLLLADSGPSDLVGLAARELLNSPRFQVIPLAALTPLMQQRDAETGVTARIKALREEGRQALLALADDVAARKVDEALALARSAFVRFYEPALLAQLHLLRAIAGLNQSRPDLAGEDFRRAHQLDAELILDAHYSPQVREAFARALEHEPEAATPPPSTELTALFGLQPEARYAIVLAADTPQEGTVLLKGLALERGALHYTLIDASSISIAPAAAAQARARELGVKLKAWLEARVEAGAQVGVKAPVLPASPAAQPRPATAPPRAWYARWYVWVAAAIVVGGVATAVPLALQRDVVALDVRW
ncbi:MAG: hypothetical protein IPL40_15255 [Proteobacteria bacterium]|nr:hypothetical protein [Pseudomonadota bacterium]